MKHTASCALVFAAAVLSLSAQDITLNSVSKYATIKFPVSGADEDVYGITLDASGPIGSRLSPYRYVLRDKDGKTINDEYINGTRYPSLGGDAEIRRFELLIQKRSAELAVTLALDEGGPVTIKNVHCVRGGFPADPPVPEAPYVHWIRSLKADAALAAKAPLMKFGSGGARYSERTCFTDVSDEEEAQLKTDVAPYRSLAVADLMKLVPDRRPFAFSAGRFGSAPFIWTPAEPDVIRTKEGAVFDFRTKYPVKGSETVTAPSGKSVTYEYCAVPPDDTIFKGRRAYLDYFLTTSRINALCKAAQSMALLYRKNGDREYGIRSAAILWTLARAIPDWPVRGQMDWNSPPSENHLFPSDLYRWFSFIYTGGSGTSEWYLPESGFSTEFARWYDLIRDAPFWDDLPRQEGNARAETENGLMHIARMMLMRDAYYRYSEFVIYHNLSGSAHQTYITLGRALGCPDLVHYGARKAFATIRKSFMADGVFPESTTYALDQMNRQKGAFDALIGHRDPAGYRYADGKRFDDFTAPENEEPFYRVAVDALNRQGYPDGGRLTIHDAWSRTGWLPRAYAPEMPERNTVVPHLFPSFGHGITGLGERAGSDMRMEAHLHYSGNYNHHHADMLGFILWAYGDELVNDIGYANPGKYAGTSAAHNLVVVDKSSQVREGIHAGGTLAWHAREGASQVIQADGSTAVYPQCPVYRRLLVLVPFGPGRNAVVDIFEVSGGTTHDWMANGCGDHPQSAETTLKNGRTIASLAPNGVPLLDPLPFGSDSKSAQKYDAYGTEDRFYGAFRNVQIYANAAPWTMTFRDTGPVPKGTVWAGERAQSTDPKPGLRLHWIAPLDGEAMLCDAPSQRYRDTREKLSEATKAWPDILMKKVIVRRTGASLESVFTAVWEPFNGTPFLTGASPIAGDIPGVIMHDGKRTCIVGYRASKTQGAFKADGIIADCRYFISMTGGSEESLDVYDGLSAETPSFSVEMLPFASLPVKRVMTSNASIIVLEGNREHYPDSTPHADQFISFVQEGRAVRAVRCASVIQRGNETQVTLADDCGFTYDNAGEGMLRETFFPFRTEFGRASVRFPSWLNIRRSGDTIRVRTSGVRRLLVKNAAAKTIRGKTGSLPFSAQDTGIAFIPPAGGNGWTELSLER
ncbi:MAG: heparinase II/III family protein [Spirochaetota bacterium]